MSHPTVAAERVKEFLGSAQDVLILDFRGPSDYAKGHIRKALNVNLPTLVQRRLLNGKLNLNQVYILSINFNFAAKISAKFRQLNLVQKMK